MSLALLWSWFRGKPLKAARVSSEVQRHERGIQPRAETDQDIPRANDAVVDRSTDAKATDVQGPAVLDIVTMVLAPASLLTGLGIYFGFLHTHAFYRFLNVDASVLSFSTTDYLIRGVNGFLVPLAAIMFSVLVLGLIHTALEATLSRMHGTHAAVLLPLVVGLLGAALVVNALVSLLFGRSVVFPPHLGIPASMCAGVVLGLMGLRLAHGQRPTPHLQQRPYSITLPAVVLFALGALLGTAQYADTSGRSEARQFAQLLEHRPAVLIHSRSRRELDGDGQLVAAEDGPSTYQYSGYRLVLLSGGKYLLLSEGWTPSEGTAVLIEDGPGMRLELSRGRLQATSPDSA